MEKKEKVVVVLVVVLVLAHKLVHIIFSVQMDRLSEIGCYGRHRSEVRTALYPVRIRSPRSLSDKVDMNYLFTVHWSLL
ncbi:unnamed protein product, partial [Brenthis ino]